MLRAVGGSHPRTVTSDVPQQVHGTRATVEGQLVYAVGDVHGRYDLLKDILAKISADAAARAQGRRPVLILLGDYVDRGPDSAKVLEALAWLRRRDAFDLHLLKGNHDQMLLDFLDEPERLVEWLRTDGVPTLRSYGVEPPRDEGGVGVIRARDELLDAMPASHLLLLRSLKLMVSVGDYAFVHAGVRPGTALQAQSEDDLLWIKDDFLEDIGPFPKVIVHGHSWTDDRPRILSHRVGIDTGAYRTGVLTAVRLEDRKVGVIQARDLD